MNSREMISSPGYSPPNTRNASHVPTNGTDSSTDHMIRRPVPDSRSSGSE